MTIAKDDKELIEKLAWLEKFWKRHPQFRLRKNSKAYKNLIITIKQEIKE
ncbi:hypothetical protein KY321_03950 [Candidatus Woesearchaeota archaeon]|nr:hypothetical protein [Candidatus Woesearchaeota archaeon]